MRVWGVAALCVALGGCVTNSSPPPVAAAAPAPKPTLQPYNLKNDEIAAVKAGVKSVLKDPDSARFGKMIAGSDGSTDVTVCLMVNAKNSYGGFTGEKPYMGLLFTDKDKKKKVFAVAGDTRPEMLQYRDQATIQVCSDRGLLL